jgi:hypothetical protein
MSIPMNFDSWHLKQLALDARKRTAEQPREAITTVILAGATAEAFINELGGFASSFARNVGVPEQIHELGRRLKACEEKRKSLLQKYHVAAEILSGTRFDESTAPFQDFMTLVNLRNDLMHMKHLGGHRDSDCRVQLNHPESVLTLSSRGIASMPTSGVASWLDQIQNQAVAVWACDAVHEIILAIFKMQPLRDFDEALIPFLSYGVISGPRHDVPN